MSIKTALCLAALLGPHLGCYTQLPESMTPDPGTDRSPIGQVVTPVPGVEVVAPPFYLDVDLQIETLEVRRDESVVTRFSLTNTVSRGYVQKFGSSCQFYVYLLDSNGRHVAPQLGCQAFSSEFVLPPGETATFEQDLLDWFQNEDYDISPGMYYIGGGFKSGETWVSWANPYEIRVLR